MHMILTISVLDCERGTNLRLHLDILIFTSITVDAAVAPSIIYKLYYHILVLRIRLFYLYWKMQNRQSM